MLYNIDAETKRGFLAAIQEAYLGTEKFDNLWFTVTKGVEGKPRNR